MIVIRLVTWPTLLLSIVILSHKADAVCRNSETSRPLRFEMPQNERREYRYFIPLLEGFQLALSCCVVSKSPSVSWLFNGKPLSEFGDILSLSVDGQYIESSGEALINNTVLEGVYNCTAVQGNETLSAEFTVRSISTSNEQCSQGKTNDVLLGHPPSSIHRIVTNSSLTLECTVLLFCHPSDGYEEVYWEKYYMSYAANAKEPKDDEYEEPTELTDYILMAPDPYDNQTRNYVNVTKRIISENYVLVTSILYIANVSDNDLHDPYNPGGYAYLPCYNNDTSCWTNRTRNYYKCGFLGSGTVNPLQDALARSRTVTLFSGGPPTAPPQMAVQTASNKMERDGVIIGSTIGAAFILVIVFALLFVAHEWHLKLYIRRILLQLRRNNGTKTANYKYNCYVACCNYDEKFVYEVLRGQMEDHHGYQLCLPERDFSIGTAIPDEIERCIRSSEYFMALISPGFWETAWCQLSVDMALRTNAKVVAVIAKERGKDQRDQDNKLMTALKSPGCTRIDSSFVTQEGSWEKLILRLRYAMPRLDSI